MTGPSIPGERTERRSRRGLIIEGTIEPRAGAETRRKSGDAALEGLDLSARSEARPYQSLLDDAIRLARRCRSLRAEGWGPATSS